MFPSLKSQDQYPSKCCTQQKRGKELVVKRMPLFFVCFFTMSTVFVLMSQSHCDVLVYVLGLQLVFSEMCPYLVYEILENSQ